MLTVLFLKIPVQDLIMFESRDGIPSPDIKKKEEKVWPVTSRLTSLGYEGSGVGVCRELAGD